MPGKHTGKIKRLTALLLIMATVSLYGCAAADKTVVVYTSVDQVYSEQIFKLFEQKTGIKVMPVYDIEASKTVGLANRLVSEKDNPQADVFWSGEILQTIDLKKEGILTPAKLAAAKDLPETFIDPDGHWFAFGGRARVLIYNKALISEEECPKTMEALISGENVKQIGIANPVFGTTNTHAAALYAVWGDERAKAYFQSAIDADITVLEGNSVVKDYVSQKKLMMGLTDTDDAFSEMKTNADLDILLLDQGEGEIGTLVIPNTVAKIKGGPNSAAADAFMEFLLSSEAEQEMVKIGWVHIPAHADVAPSEEFKTGDIRITPIGFYPIYEKLEIAKNDMTELFAR